MRSMSHTEVTSRSWTQRVGTALVMVLLGLVLLPACTWLLFWNEGRSVGVARALAEGAGIVFAVPGERIDPAMEGKLVHLTGAVVPQSIPRDTQLGIEADGAIGLLRRVEMFQWVETSESRTQTKLGGSEETVTVYSYSRQWHADHIDSTSFKISEGHENPDRMLPDERFIVPDVLVGAFGVEGALLADVGQHSVVDLRADDAGAIARGLRGRRPVSLGDAGVYVGQDAAAPAIGDLRISFQRIDLGRASLVGVQTGERIGAYTAGNGQSFLLAEAGTVPAQAMFETADAQNAVMTWLLRAAGLAGLFLGFFLILNVLSVLVSVLPFLGSLVGFGGAVLAFLLALVLGATVIALAWLVYRPVLAGLLLACVAAVVILVLRLRRRAPRVLGAG